MTIANKSVALILVLIAAIGASSWLLDLGPLAPAEPQYALRLPEARELAAFHLIDQDGNEINNEWFEGRWTMVFFGFTHCPDICPATLNMLSAARKQMADADPNAPLPDILLVTVDPARDTPEALKLYIEHFGEGISGATGPLDQVQKLATMLGIYFQSEAGEENTAGEDYNVAHSAHVIVIDEHGNYSAVFGPPHSVGAFTTDMPLLMRPR